MTEKHEQNETAHEVSAIDEHWEYSRCPECQAVFRVDQSKLVVRKGEVRCGACRMVFHAPSNKVFRNDSGGFSALSLAPAAKQPAEHPVVLPEPVTENSIAGPELNVFEDDQFETSFTNTIDRSSASNILFSETREEKDPVVDSVGSRSRLFDEQVEVAEETTVSLHIGGSTTSNNPKITIPKISSEPLVSRPQEDPAEYRREPIISTASAEASSVTDDLEIATEPLGVTPFQADQETVRAAREELIFRPLSQIESDQELEEKPEAETLAPTSFSPRIQTGGGWNDEQVKPYGATAMPMAPQFEPVIDSAPHAAELLSKPQGTTDQWRLGDDSLLDHNPFSSKTAELAQPPVAEIKVEPRPSAINMSGVDEYIVDRPNPLAGFFWFLVSAAFVVLLGLQVKYFLVERFAQNEAYRPYLQIFCGIARCELSPRRDAYRFTITQTRVDLHPQEPGALRITVRLLNQAKFAQPYPDLRLTLTDRVGRVVGRRKFDPDFYLPKGAATRLAPGELGYVVFDLAHPHEKAVGFVVDVVRRSS